MKLFVMLSLAILTACNPLSTKKSAFGEKFQPGVPVPRTSNTTPDEEPVEEPNLGGATGFKVSPGSGSMAGSDHALKATITTNDRRLTGTRLSGRFSINKSQVR